MAFNRFIRAALTGGTVTLFGDGEQTRDFTFVGDAVAATAAAGDQGRPGAVYNIGGGSRVTINQVLDKIARITGKPLDIRRLPAEKGDMRDTFADTSSAAADTTPACTAVSCAFDPNCDDTAPRSDDDRSNATADDRTAVDTVRVSHQPAARPARSATTAATIELRRTSS